jgi:hypothetical protein
MESAGFDGRLGLNSFIQTGQVYAYKIPMGNRVRIIASQTHTRLPNGWRFCPISIPMGTIFVSYPYPHRGIPNGLSGIGSPLTSLPAGKEKETKSQSFFAWDITTNSCGMPPIRDRLRSALRASQTFT